VDFPIVAEFFPRVSGHSGQIPDKYQRQTGISIALRNKLCPAAAEQDARNMLLLRFSDERCHMTDERIHHVTLKLVEKCRFVAEFADVPGASVVFDEPPPLGDNRAPNAAEVLGAAVGNCLAASLTFCLRRSRIDVQDMAADVTTHVGRNERGRMWIRSIDVKLEPIIAAGMNIDRCEALFEDFCLVTASVQQGIPVHVSLKRQADDKAA
jgi:uncharacterized OsmC-like protein